MRDPNRIHKFCDELAALWEKNAPDWRFGQLICNVFGDHQAAGHDVWFPEEDQMIEIFRDYFKEVE